MSISMSRAEGVTVLTLTSDPDSVCPPLCQILGGLCHCRELCSVSQRLRSFQHNTQSLLGALQIISGLFNLGVGGVVLAGSCWQTMIFEFTIVYEAPYWLGTLFIFFGIMSILSERFPSPCLVVVTVILNLCGIAFAITAIIYYIKDTMATWNYWGSCNVNGGYWYYRQTTTTPSPEDSIYARRVEGNQLISMIERSSFILLIVFSLLELCLLISSVTMSIKALHQTQNTANKSECEPMLGSISSPTA